MRTDSRESAKLLLIGAIAAVTVLVISARHLWLVPGTGEVDLNGSNAQSAKVPEGRQSSAESPGGPESIQKSAQLSASEIISRKFQDLRFSPDATKSAEILRELGGSLRSVSDRAGAISAIVSFLNGGNDAQTGLGFAVQSDGSLAAAPSLRVALLDYLGEMDRTAAARYAETIFQRSNVPDEWAVALRDLGKDLGRSAASVSPTYKGRVEDLLTRKEWLEKPTPGYLHAFDSAVFIGGKDVVEKLVAAHDTLVNPQIVFASRLALDRLALNDFGTTAEVIRRGRDSFAVDPKDRAAILSRANPLSSHDVELIYNYLKDETVGLGEKAWFLRSFPNANLELSNNLLTSNNVLLMANVAEMDRAALAILRQWFSENWPDVLRAELQDQINFLRDVAAKG
jgi:hypothetical protein